MDWCEKNYFQLPHRPVKLEFWILREQGQAEMLNSVPEEETPPEAILSQWDFFLF